MFTSGAAKVGLTEQDISTSVPAIRGAAAAQVLVAPRGPLTPRLVTNPSDLLRWYTPKGTIDLTMDESFFHALAYLGLSNKLWINRAQNGAVYGGYVFRSANAVSPDVNIPVEAGFTDPATYDLTTDDGTAGGEALTTTHQKALLLYGADPGAWNNNISVEVITDVTKVKEPNAFLIKVYNNSILAETWMVSRDPSKRDLNGNNLFVETVLEGSNFIRAINNAAMDVTVQPLATAAPVAFEHGADGNAVTDADMSAALAPFADKNKYPIVLIHDSGWCTATYQKAIIDLCEARADCAFILSVPYTSENQADPIVPVTTYKTTTLNSTSTYGGIFAPHVQVLDQANNRQLYIAPSGLVAGKYAQNFDLFGPWQPTAGSKRGTLNVLGLLINYDEGQLDTLADANVNPIKFKQGSGIRIWGQKTLQTRPSALSRMNARMTLIAIEPPITAALEDFLFELNEPDNKDGLRLHVLSVINNYLSTVKDRGGLDDFKVICDDSNNTGQDVDNHVLNVWILVKVPSDVEWINVVMGITANSMSFSLAESLVQ